MNVAVHQKWKCENATLWTRPSQWISFYTERRKENVNYCLFPPYFYLRPFHRSLTCASRASNSTRSHACRPRHPWENFTARRVRVIFGAAVDYPFPGLSSDCLRATRRDARQPPLATQHNTPLGTRGSRPTADGTLTEKTSKRRRDGRAACKASRGGGGGGGGGGGRAESAAKGVFGLVHHHRRHLGGY